MTTHTIETYSSFCTDSTRSSVAKVTPKQSECMSVNASTVCANSTRKSASQSFPRHSECLLENGRVRPTQRHLTGLRTTLPPLELNEPPAAPMNDSHWLTI